MSAKRLAGALVLAAFAVPLSAQRDPGELLIAARRKLLEAVNRLPRYMCTETIERCRYEPVARHSESSCDGPDRGSANLRMITSDRLRLDVGMTATHEIYSWVGENHFDERTLFDIVPSGAISSGSFAGFLASIFENDAAEFTWNGNTSENGNALMEFGYHIPRERSHYRFGINKEKMEIIPYDGTFLLDPNTLDLVRLIVRAGHLPPETAACEAATTLDYGRVQLNGATFMLPRETRFRISHVDGTETENRTTYSGCREFHAESTVTFDPPPAVPGRAAPKSSPRAALDLPPGLAFRTALTQPIDTSTAAAGDRIDLRLMDAIRLPAKNVVAPQGAVVSGRITRIQHDYARQSAVTIVVKLESIDVNGARIPLEAAQDRQVNPLLKKNGVVYRIDLGTLASLEDPDTAILYFLTGNKTFVVPRGTEIRWLTFTGPNQQK
jgi:hypothetical protein